MIKSRRCKTSSTPSAVLHLCIIFSFYLANLWVLMNLIYMNSRSGRPRIPVLTMTTLTMTTLTMTTLLSRNKNRHLDTNAPKLG